MARPSSTLTASEPGVRRWLDRFYAALMVLSAAAMVLCFASVMLGIADRQLALGLRGLDAYAGYAIAAALFLALPGTLQRGEHIRVTLLLQRLPAVWRGLLEWWSLLAGAALTGFLAFYATRLVWLSWQTHDISQGSDATPLWLPQIGMALGCVGLAVAMLDAIGSRLAGSHFEQRAAGGEPALVE
jgi:TRAP-type C4-dicarboxylate transport system permease small subunit